MKGAKQAVEEISENNLLLKPKIFPYFPFYADILEQWTTGVP